MFVFFGELSLRFRSHLVHLLLYSFCRHFCLCENGVLVLRLRFEAGWPSCPGVQHSQHDFSPEFYPFILTPSCFLIPSLDFMARLNRPGQSGAGSKSFYVPGSVLKLVCQVVQSSRATLGHWDCCLDTEQWLSPAFEEHSGENPHGMLMLQSKSGQWNLGRCFRKKTLCHCSDVRKRAKLPRIPWSIAG